jgi:rod shape-determining protein MreC
VALTRRAGRSTRLLVVSLVMASLLIITLDYRQGQSGVFETVGRATYSIISPMQAAVAKLFRPIGAFFQGVGHIGSLASENRDLKSEVERLKISQVSLVNLERQIEQLQNLLNLRARLNLRDTVGANVVGSSISNFEWTVTLDRGEREGVAVNQPVVTADGLVGHVLRVLPGQCIVQLIIDPRSSVGARLAATGETGLIVGERNRDLQMELVPPEADVPPGEEVVTSGYQGGLYPPGLPIGAVSHVYTDPGSLTKVIQVRPAVDFASLEFVLIVTNPQDSGVPPSVTPPPSPSPSPSPSESPFESPSPEGSASP